MQPEKKAQSGPLASTNPSSSGRVGSYVGPSLQIKGEIIGNEDLKLDGRVEGLMSIGGYRLSIGTSSTVVGEIIAREVVICGEVAGDISAFDRIEIKKSASVVGDLSTGKIIVEEGAFFKGTIQTDSNSTQIGTDLESLFNRIRKDEEK